MSNTVADAVARHRALDPAQSFIVQAPAGSGKTELLTQRFLRLLACVRHPEEIIALTFTRKAAAEMRARISTALHDVAAGKTPESDNDKTRFSLAAKALQRDAECHWQLQENPQRLRVMTIDAFNGALVRQMPLMSRMGGPLTTTDRAGAHYREAVRRSILHLEQEGEYQSALATLLGYFDNRVERVEQQLVTMLAKREQWLSLVGSTLALDEAELKRQLEAVLAEHVETRIRALCEAVPEGLPARLLPLARFAAEQLRVSGRQSPILSLLDITEMPGSDWPALDQWKAIAALLLISDKATPRKKVNVGQGFPAGANFADNKQAMQAVLGALVDAPAFLHCLDSVRNLPERGYSDLRWRVLRALCKVLLLTVAALRVEFAAHGQVDHSENTLRALQALGDEDQPSDLALSLDYRIHHLLVDEFQDTSVAQFDLLARLLRGWQPGDGRSLFLVGDPMQSIYRFRQAEVSLFLGAREYGVGDVALTPLYLTQNFRASAALVGWVNRTFAQVFPAVENLAEGTVAFAASTTTVDAPSDDASSHDTPPDDTQVHIYPAPDWRQEAQQIVDIIQHSQQAHPERTIAVLVRSRTHLLPLYPLLQAHAIDYQAVGIEKLSEREVVRDLLSLTRALLHPADAIAWLAILRAPWCGLTLADLLVLSDVASASAAVLDAALVERLSDDGAQRLQRFQSALRPALQCAGRVPWAGLVRSTWLALGGPACVANTAAINDAKCFFEQLTAAQNASPTLSVSDLQQRLAEQVAPVETPGDTRLQLMTIHKSKGLEFDTVIVPGLGRFGRGDEALPIKWLQTHDGRLLLAPAKQPDEPEADAIYQLIGAVEKEKADNELKRLLYVAVTRARSSIHLLGHATIRNNGVSCDKRSLLQVIWPQVEAAFADLCAACDDDEVIQDLPASPPLLHRLPGDWRMPPLQPALGCDDGVLNTQSPSQPDQQAIEFDWASLVARHIGTVVHQYLQRIADEGVAHWSLPRISAQRAAISASLKELGVAQEACEQAVKRCQETLNNTLDDPRGRWLLSSHQHAASEFAVSGLHEGGVAMYIIDRTFIDESGVRWIVDYKTGDHQGGDSAQFLDREKTRYQQQLQGYAELMQHLDSAPIRLGLYFPTIKGWREWAAGEG